MKVDAVQHVHSKGIVHHDIRSDNCILGSLGTALEGRLYLIDFEPYCDLENAEYATDDRGSSDSGPGSSTSDCSSLVLNWVTWSELWSTVDIVNCRLAWSDGGLLAEGYPALFGDFYTYALRLKYRTMPEHDAWWVRFRDALTVAMAGERLPEGPLYHLADTVEPLVGRGDLPIPLCNDGWMPAEEPCWNAPYTVKEDEALGDELKIVEDSRVRVFKEMPTS
uniref:N/A n=1 Tax=Ganoderma boninense TaxID=34458 RepID=A0A5K1JRT3_9APHY|nr:N/A [Ganoderma boninense]